LANRTIDKHKSSLGRARSVTPRGDAAEATEERDAFVVAQSDEPAAETEQGSEALAEDEDEDLRIAPVSGGALAVRPGAQTTARGTGVPDFLMGNPITRFIAESYLELLKVTWPEPRDAWNSALVVVGMSVAVALLLGAADYGLNQLVQFVLTHAVK
jgi:preprotein translocase SecE subunit